MSKPTLHINDCARSRNITTIINTRGEAPPVGGFTRTNLIVPAESRPEVKKEGKIVLLYWAVIFFVIALVAAVFGFTGIAVAAAGIAKILFFVFLVLFLALLIGGLFRRPRRGV